MAKIVGTITTSHVPAIGGAIAKGLQNDPYWKPFFDGFPPVREWLAKVKPDVVVLVYNDHGLNFFLDKMPTFAVGAADEYRNADEGWGIPTVPPFRGDSALSWHLIESLVAEDFDLDDLPGDGGRPRLHLADGAVLARHEVAGAHRSGLRQHGAGAAALGGALLPARPGDRAGDRVMAGRRAGGGDGHRRPVAPARRRTRRLHQQGFRSQVHGQHGLATRPGRRSIRPPNWSSSRARKASNC